MAVVRRIRNRGATITVEANAEVEFMPGGSVHSWTNMFTGRIRAKTEAVTPRNKRPRWDHYGEPLRNTLVSARPRFWSNGGDRQRVYGAVGSTAPHAYYVDQGTGVYNGSGPYQAKILPPWQRGEGSLYEASWRAAGPQGRRARIVMIQGQKGQKFFEKGLGLAFRSMKLRAAQVGGPRIGNVLNTIPTGLDNFKGNTPVSGTFELQLEKWRQWKSDAWARNDIGRRIRPERDNRKPPKAPKPPKAAKPPKPPKPAKPPRTNQQKAIEAAKQEMRLYMMRNPQARIAGYNDEGFLVIDGTGQQKRIYWSMRVADLFADAGSQFKPPPRS